MAYSIKKYIVEVMNNELPDGDTKTVKFLLKENLARYKLNKQR